MKIFKGIKLEDFSLTPQDIQVHATTAVIIKKSWPYELAHSFQEIMVEKIYEHPDESLFIFCSHPSCLTLGRGLQKTATDIIPLIDFDPLIEEQLSLKIHRIKRGGGITFHHERQIVLYPMISLDHKKYKVFDFMLLALSLIKNVLEKKYGLQSLEVRSDLLGLWAKQFKIASIGLSTRKFVTYHGVALNLGEDQKIQEALSMIFPCGLPGSAYSNVSRILQKDISFEDLQPELMLEFLKSINDSTSRSTKEDSLVSELS
nr:lipoyl(octanoyl) transferase LipB [Bacteriovorax sp. HI3]